MAWAKNPIVLIPLYFVEHLAHAHYGELSRVHEYVVDNSDAAKDYLRLQYSGGVDHLTVAQRPVVETLLLMIQMVYAILVGDQTGGSYLVGVELYVFVRADMVVDSNVECGSQSLVEMDVEIRHHCPHHQVGVNMDWFLQVADRRTQHVAEGNSWKAARAVLAAATLLGGVMCGQTRQHMAVYQTPLSPVIEVPVVVHNQHVMSLGDVQKFQGNVMDESLGMVFQMKHVIYPDAQ